MILDIQNRIVCPRCRRPCRPVQRLRIPHRQPQRRRLMPRAAAGDVLLDPSGNVMLDTSGNIMLDNGLSTGNICCCGHCNCANWTTTPRKVKVTFTGMVPIYPIGSCNGNGVILEYFALNGTFILPETSTDCSFALTIGSPYYTLNYYQNNDCSGGLIVSHPNVQISCNLTGATPGNNSTGEVNIIDSGSLEIFNSMNWSGTSCSTGWTANNNPGTADQTSGTGNVTISIV